MKEDSFGELLKEEIREEVKDIKLSFNTKESIKNKTIRKKYSLYDRILKLMNTTIEIPVAWVGAASIAVLILCGSPFIVTNSAKYSKDIFGYTSIKTVKIQGADIVFPKSNFGGFVNEKDKD